MKFIIDKLRNINPSFSPPLFKGMIISIIAMAFIVPLGLVAMPYIEFFNDLAVQPKGKAQGYYGRTVNAAHVVDQAPPKGTLPQGVYPYPVKDIIDETPDKDKKANEDATAIEAGKVLKNDVALTEENLKKGQEIYNTFCIVCHGKWGEGNGPVVGPNRFPAPPTLHDDAIKAYPDGRIYHVMTKGKNTMPGYEDKISQRDRWYVVHYLRVLHRALDPKPEDYDAAE